VENLARRGDGENEKDEPFTCLTQGARISRSPRFSPEKDGISKLVYLCSKLGFDTHHGGIALHVQDWNVTECAPVPNSQNMWVDTVYRPLPQSGTQESDIQVCNMSFPGLWVNQLPFNCCTDEFLLTTTQWGSVERIVRISLANGNMTLLNADIARGRSGSSETGSASQSLLCVTADGGAVIMESAPNRPAIVGYVSRDALARDKVYIKVDAALVTEMGPISATSFSKVPLALVTEALDFTYDVLAMRPPQIEDHEDTPVQWILLLPKEEQPDARKPPLIVVPHGGPHSCTSTTYSPNYAFLCASGYAVLHVNYRGSIGFGQGPLESLPGHIGLLDVKDVMHATITISDSGWIDSERVGICGGSHGGFLAGHCIGQFPNLFKAAALRNPVINIPSMLTATDIPDWCFVEVFGCGYYNWKEYRRATKEEMDIMWDASPIKHAMDVVAPTLIALGMEDKRVPPSQGLEYYHLLRANGVMAELFQYDKDDHAIDKVASEADLWINVKQFFDEHL
jgi:acylaminoacyl-peptidase